MARPRHMAADNQPVGKPCALTGHHPPALALRDSIVGVADVMLSSTARLDSENGEGPMPPLDAGSRMNRLNAKKSSAVAHVSDDTIQSIAKRLYEARARSIVIPPVRDELPAG